MNSLHRMLAIFTLSASAVAQAPAGILFGTGCGGAGGQAATVTVAPVMRPGYPTTLSVQQLPPNQSAILLLGDSNTQWWGTPLPLSLASAGMPGCTMLVSANGTIPFGTFGGSATVGFVVPLEPVLAAQTVYMQVLFQQPGLNPAGIGWSRGFATRIAPMPTPTQLRSSITQHGITFTFAQPRLCGQFVNGDWFVVGPVTLANMSPPCVTVNGRVMHGAMVNPDASQLLHGYDKALYGPGNEARYVDALNVALNLAPGNPRVLAPNTSLIKVISNTNPNYVSQLETCAVLTVLPDIPPQGSFRPAYAGTDHPVRFDEQQLDLTVLRALAPATGAPTIASLLPQFERLWLDHAPGWPSRYMHPALNMPDYGRDLASLFNEAALVCNTNAPLADRRQLAIRLVQIGIDFMGNKRGGCYWEGVGGHGSGRKWPILFAGALLRDSEMLAVGQNYVSQRNLNGTYTTHFGEDCQTFYVQQTSASQINWGHGGYVAADLGVPEYGFSHVHWPASDSNAWTTNSYRLCCTANGWIGGVLGARMMGLRDEWNHQVLFDYTDRYAATEPVGWTRSWSPWVGRMWDLYRAQF
jgi:hypothetical protein